MIRSEIISLPSYNEATTIFPGNRRLFKTFLWNNINDHNTREATGESHPNHKEDYAEIDLFVCNIKIYKNHYIIEFEKKDL